MFPTPSCIVHCSELLRGTLTSSPLTPSLHPPSHPHSALELVEGLQASGEGGATALALSRLLDSNLSAKYWLLSRLAPSDIITDCEFFDAGQVSWGVTSVLANSIMMETLCI